jgi:hypothetical protein
MALAVRAGARPSDIATAAANGKLLWESIEGDLLPSPTSTAKLEHELHDALGMGGSAGEIMSVLSSAPRAALARFKGSSQKLD